MSRRRLHPIDLTNLATHYKKESNAKRIILDLVEDYFIPHIVENKTSKGMFETLVDAFLSYRVSQKFLLKTKILFNCMRMIDTTVNYLSKITKLRY